MTSLRLLKRSVKRDELDWDQPIDDDHVLLNDAVGANDNSTSNGKNSGFGMDDSTYTAQSRVGKERDTRKGQEGPAPIVMSPLSSTSWQTTALEWIVSLSRLRDKDEHG